MLGYKAIIMTGKQYTPKKEREDMEKRVARRLKMLCRLTVVLYVVWIIAFLMLLVEK